MGDVINFKQNKITVQELVDQMQENIEEFDQVIVIYKTKDGDMDISYTHQTIKDLVWAEKVFSTYNTTEMLNGDEEEH